MDKKINIEEMLQKAKKPAIDAMKLHPFYKGKVEIVPKCCIRDMNDFAIWYSPGVAEPCKAISKDKSLSYEYTNRANTIAVISDGTRVLGLGNIGPEAAMPVMEGKALLFKYLGGIDAVAICLDTTDQNEFIKTVKYLQPSFGGVNLEDIEQPKCFRVLEELKNSCTIPVWHDDQQGTATVTLAGIINALKAVNKKIGEIKIAMIGAGANVCVARLLIAAGADAGNIVMCDVNGTLHKGRTEFKNIKEQWELCNKTNRENIVGQIPDAIRGADVIIALSKPGPGTIKKEWIKTMAKDAIVFTCANPIPEIWPWEAMEAGARIVSTGRSDFPNQVNNSLGFPGIFRGVLDVRAKTITDEMCIAAAEELARCAVGKNGKINEEKILPTMDDWEVFVNEAVAVGLKAIEQGIAGIILSKEELYKKAKESILHARKETKILMDEGIIRLPSDNNT